MNRGNDLLVRSLKYRINFYFVFSAGGVLEDCSSVPQPVLDIFMKWSLALDEKLHHFRSQTVFLFRQRFRKHVVSS